MPDMSEFSVDEIVRAVDTDDVSSRTTFVAACPPTAMKQVALQAAQMDMPEMRAQALDFLGQGYATSGPFDLGAKIAEACHRLARRAYEEGIGDQSTCRMIAGRGALNWMTCLQRLGQHSEIVRLIEEPTQWLESIGDTDNLDMLKLTRVEAELDLENYDEAERRLSLVDEPSLPPMVKVTYRAIKYRIDQHKGGGTSLRGEQRSPTGEDLRKTLDPLGDISSGSERSEGSGDSFDAYKDVAGHMVERLFGGTENEFTVRQKIIQSTWLFRDEDKGRDPGEIRKVEPVLVAARDWMKENNFPDSENDACWGLYLCYTRTGRDDLAVAELQRMRANIESARSKIEDPLERARLSERYPHLHAVECALLCKLGRSEHLFEAIEASKGRAVADLQTQRDGRPADETQFPAAVRELPSYMQRLGSHYLTTFVDDEAVYCSLVTSDGQIHSSQVELTKEALTELAFALDPQLWGKKHPYDPYAPRLPADIPKRLSGVVDWGSPLLESGVIKEGDHLCYSPHDMLLLVPLHYVELDGRAMVDILSMSRIHGAHSLMEILRHDPDRPESYMAVEVPSVQDLDNKAKLDAFQHAARWLGTHFWHGERLSREEASVGELSSKDLRGRLLHFATHGRFPEQDRPHRDPNPFRASGLVLAAEGRLPDLTPVMKDQAGEHMLTPERAVELQLDLTGSHLTLQACVSGLAKTGYGGDALGLEWAFLLLGAESILSTHWDVSAQTSARFAESFYDRWLVGGESRASAWRNTLLDFRNDPATSDPYHWAAFSLIGDWR